MKKLLIILVMIPTMSQAQSDTIVTRTKTIPCTITLDNGQYLFYNDKKREGESIAKTEVIRYVHAGAPIKPVLEVKTIAESKSAVIDSVNITDDMAHLKMCLLRCHHQKNLGAGIAIAGAALAGASFAPGIDGDGRTGMIIGAGILALTGTIITIDANKWFKRAAFGIGSEGVGIKYRLK